MDTEIIIAVLALVGTLAGSYFSNNKHTAVMDEKIKDLKKDIAVLSDRVDRHNNLVERMAIVEEHIKMSDKNKNDETFIFMGAGSVSRFAHEVKEKIKKIK